MTRRQLVEAAVGFDGLIMNREAILAVGTPFVVNRKVDKCALLAVTHPDFMRGNQVFGRWVDPVEESPPKTLESAPRDPVPAPAAFHVGGQSDRFTLAVSPGGQKRHPPVVFQNR